MISMNNLLRFQPLRVTDIDINITRKQYCDVDDCKGKYFARFCVTPYNGHIKTAYCCPHCTSKLTQFSLYQLSYAEQYIQRVKPHFRMLKDKSCIKTISNHKNQDTTGQINYKIGDNKIIITEFKNYYYGLIINGRIYNKNLLKYFDSYKTVYERNVEIINNIYIIRIYNFLNHGTQFIMP